MSKEDTEGAKVSIEDFVSQHKLTAFVNTYAAVDAEGHGVEVFNDSKLRQYFQAFPRNIGDPLNWYLDALSRNGYVMRTSIQGEPAIFVRRKVTAHETSMIDTMFGRNDDDENENDNENPIVSF